jgi:hypothetical protein
METAENNTAAVECPVRGAWHRPEMERLIISVTTQDFLKDGSSEDLDTKANDAPYVPPV